MNAKKLKQLRKTARNAIMGDKTAAEDLAKNPDTKAVHRAINVAADSASVKRAVAKKKGVIEQGA